MSMRIVVSERAQALRDAAEELSKQPIGNDDYYEREGELRESIANLYAIAPREAQKLERELSLIDCLC